MKKTVITILLCTVLYAAVFAQNASDFKTDGRGTITGYEGWDKVIAIPEKIGNVTITAITGKVFERLELTGITLPASIKTIGESVFSGNKLTSLTIPAGVTIGKEAFANNQLTSLTVGDRVTIGYEAFSNNKLTSLTVGNGGSISGNAFANNRGIKTLVLGEGINIYQGIDTYNNAINNHTYYDYMCNSGKAGTYDNTVRYSAKTEGDYTFIPTAYGAVITRYNGSSQAVQIPAELGGTAVKGIDKNDDDSYSGAFARKRITRIQLPEGLAFIGDSAFTENQLTSVTIPNSVTSIGFGAFSNNQLTSVTIGADVTVGYSNAFYQAYNNFGKRAGTYTYNSRNNQWTRK